MEKLFLIAFTLTVAKAGYLHSDSNLYSSSGLSIGGSGGENSFSKGASAVVYTSFAPTLSQEHAGDFSPQVSHGTSGYVSSGAKHGEHVPVIKNGVPVDTPEVQRARAEHFALYAKAAAAAAKASASDEKYSGRYSGQTYYQPKYTQTYYHKPSVQQSADYSAAYSLESNHLPSSSPGGSQAYAQIVPEPGHVKSQQQFVTFVGAAAASDSANDAHYRRRRGLDYAHFSQELYDSQPQHVPLITKEGVPVETPEVQAAKLQHLLAHAEAKAGQSAWKQDYGRYGVPETNKFQFSVIHEDSGFKYHGPQHIPQLDKNGVPVETPEVQAAKAQHFLAHSQAKLNSQGLNHGWQQQGIGSYSHYAGSLGSSLSPQGTLITSEGVPEDTPEVKIAKARHFLAHEQEKIKQAQSGYDDISVLHHYE